MITPRHFHISSICVSVFLAVPIIAQTIPYLGSFFFWLIPVVLILVLINWQRCDFFEFFKESSSNIILLINISVGSAVLLDSGFLATIFSKEVVRGFGFLAVSLLLLQLKFTGRCLAIPQIIKIFSLLLISIGLAASIMGLIKYGFLISGHSFDFLITDEQRYPWGTSLVGDYNFYALSLLISALLAVKMFSDSFDLKKALLWSFVIGIIFNAAILTGSRRFWFLGPLLLLSLLLIIYIKKRGMPAKTRWKELFVGVIISTSVIHGALYIADSPCHPGKLGCWGTNSELQLRMQSFVDESPISTRLDRWRYTFEIIEPSRLIFGSGFSYRQEFGCKFQACKSDDYPHAPILSALLYGGLVGVFSVLACFIYALVTSYQILTRQSSHADLALGLIATTVFVFVSGDSLLSMPVFFSMLLISRCVVWLK